MKNLIKLFLIIKKKIKGGERKWHTDVVIVVKK